MFLFFSLKFKAYVKRELFIHEVSDGYVQTQLNLNKNKLWLFRGARQLTGLSRHLNEVWKIVKEISSPNRNNNIILNEDGIEITDGKEVAEIFNNFFIQKIEKLKDNIDISIVEDPLERLRNKMQPKNLKFSLQTVTEAKVLKAIKQMKNKKSAGRDEITQEQMIMGAEVLAIPLTRIINASITEGKFPDIWKSAVITPVLKKGSSKDKTN